jgi:hypothetical protein
MQDYHWAALAPEDLAALLGKQAGLRAAAKPVRSGQSRAA